MKVESFQRDLALKDDQIDRLNGKLTTISQSLNSIAAEKRGLLIKLETVTKQAGKSDASETELGYAREELNRFKLQLSQNNALVQKLESEKDSSEKKHGQSTALVGMVEAQLLQI